MDEVFKNVDCIELYVSDLDDGIKYYCGSMGLKLLWRTDTSVGLGMENDITEILLQTERPFMSVDMKVESVVKSIDKIIEAGGKVLEGPFLYGSGRRTPRSAFRSGAGSPPETLWMSPSAPASGRAERDPAPEAAARSGDSPAPAVSGKTAGLPMA